MRNDQVIRLWLNGGRQTTARTSNGNLSVRDGRLYSYNLIIGMENGGIIYDYTAGSGNFYSQTTSQHVGIAKRLATRARIVDPRTD